MTIEPSRRQFLISTSALLGTGWLSSCGRDAELPRPDEIEKLGAGAQQAKAAGQGFQNLSSEEARTLSAFTEQIVPSDELPGAREAGAIYFIDGALAGFGAPFKEPVQAAARALDEAARRENRDATSFADLTSAQQIRVIKRFETSEFFGLLRTLTVLGVFADPKYGGNREQAGFRIVAVQHAPAYSPPFGYYDAQETARLKARR